MRYLHPMMAGMGRLHLGDRLEAVVIAAMGGFIGLAISAAVPQGNLERDAVAGIGGCVIFLAGRITWDRFHRAHPETPPALARAEANSYVARRDVHHAQLRNFLGLVPFGKPAGPLALVWDDLMAHLGSDHPIWALEGRLRELVVAATDQSAMERLERSKRVRGLGLLTGSNFTLSSRLAAETEGAESSFPDLPWFIEDSFGEHLLKFGAAWGVAHVRSCRGAMAISHAMRDIWDEIPEWREVKALRTANAQLAAVRADLTQEIAELQVDASFPPGICRHCPTPPK